MKVSERRVCRVLGQHRSTQRRLPQGRADEERLVADMIELARQFGRYGYRRVAALLRDAGWHVKEADCPSMRPPAKINEQLWMTEMRAGAHNLITREAEADSLFVYHQMQSRIDPLDVNGLLAALQERAGLIREWEAFLQRYPVVICPVSGDLPFAQQQDVSSSAAFAAIMESQLTQRALPVLGLPGLAVSTDMVGDIPVGVQLIAGRFREDILLAAGTDIERASHKIMVADV